MSLLYYRRSSDSNAPDRPSPDRRSRHRWGLIAVLITLIAAPYGRSPDRRSPDRHHPPSLGFFRPLTSPPLAVVFAAVGHRAV